MPVDKPKTYLVGGAVRDKLLGLTPHEFDYVVVGATPEVMLAQGYRQVGADFPVFLHPETHDEYALARTERKKGHGYKGFVFATKNVTLEQDLLRRDLTINAIAEAENGELIDPYGGTDDIRNKILRHVSDAFSEDPLRVLRVARFAARFPDFSVAAETLELMRQMAKSGELDYLVAERVQVELFKALNTNKPSRFFETLRECDALAVIFPEIDALFGVPQRADYHPEIDTGAHVMMVVDDSAMRDCDEAVRFACLCHDFGKALTPKHILPSHYGHEGAGVPITKQFCQRLRIPKKVASLAVRTTEFHTHLHRFDELSPKKVLKLYQTFGALKNDEHFRQFCDACKSDARGRLGSEQDDYPQAAHAVAVLADLQQVDTQQFIKPDMTGQQIGNAIHQGLIVALKKRLMNGQEK